MRSFIATAILLAGLLGGTFLLFQPNEQPADGPADPILGARRSVIGWLREHGLMKRRSFFGGRYLPKRGRTTWFGAEGSPAACEMRTTWEPVYQGLIWRIGQRVTYEFEHFRDDDEERDWRHLRLCYSVEGERFVAGEATLEPRQRIERVAGFIPGAATEVWIERTDREGRTERGSAWGLA